MIRFDNFSYLGEILRGKIFSEINKVIKITDQYELEGYFQELLLLIRGYFEIRT